MWLWSRPNYSVVQKALSIILYLSFTYLTFSVCIFTVKEPITVIDALEGERLDQSNCWRALLKPSTLFAHTTLSSRWFQSTIVFEKNEFFLVSLKLYEYEGSRVVQFVDLLYLMFQILCIVWLFSFFCSLFLSNSLLIRWRAPVPQPFCKTQLIVYVSFFPVVV